MIITKEQFKSAPIGTPFMMCCPICERTSGDIAIKSRGPAKRKDSPYFGINDMLAGDICPHCMARIEISEKTGEEVHGVASIQHGDDILVFVTLKETGNEVPTRDGGMVTLRHGDIIDGDIIDGGGIILVKKRER